MNKHDPTNKECRQNKECTHGWRTEPCPKCTCPAQKEECPACNGDIHAKFTVVADFPLLCEKHKNQIDGHLAEIANTPAQKEDPFSEFMKSQGINVVDVTPTQKEEWVEEYDELPSSFYRAPSHRDDCEGLVAGDIGLPCTCTTQKEEWEMQFRELPAVNYNLYLGAGTNENCLLIEDAEKQIIDFISSQISLAEARGREEANKCDECGGTDVVCAKGVMDSIRLARTETITAFEEWAGKYMTETTKYYGTDKHGIDPDDFLSFASFLKSNAPKV